MRARCCVMDTLYIVGMKVQLGHLHLPKIAVSDDGNESTWILGWYVPKMCKINMLAVAS